MNFNDEFEYEANDDQLFYVEVQGEVSDGETHIQEVTISDGVNKIESDHPLFEEIYAEALNREYEPEVHGRDFDYYDSDFNNFLKET